MLASKYLLCLLLKSHVLAIHFLHSVLYVDKGVCVVPQVYVRCCSVGQLSVSVAVLSAGCQCPVLVTDHVSSNIAFF